MAAKALFCTLLLCDLQSVWPAPAVDEVQVRLVVSFPLSDNSEKSFAHANNVESLLLGPPAWTSLPASTNPTPIPENQAYPFSFSLMNASMTSSQIPSFITVTTTKEEPTTITITAVPSTATETITVTATTSTFSPLPPPKMPETGMGPAKIIWLAPPNMTDLSSFQVSKMSGGQKNIKIITGIPPEANVNAKSVYVPEQTDSSKSYWNSGSAAIQILYPEKSINPAQKPEGGAEFYAAPIDIFAARNVSLQYRIFFPANFDWVLGGKLPGLYGGHAGCSGGNAALDCFSTRLMWRKGGAGELYLYAPKDKQTKALCSDPASVCDAVYGLSVGRGSFNYIAGAWTTVRQTIILNTPGKPDGTFVLDVNGKRAIFRDDVFYREDLTSPDQDEKPTRTTKDPHRTTTQKEAEPTTSSTQTDDGDIPILSEVLGIGGLRRRAEGGQIILKKEQENQPSFVLVSPHTKVADESIQLTTIPLPKQAASAPEPTVSITTTAGNGFGIGIESTKETEVKFAGIFFSTFFGGHETRYATPKDQYVWFKDFALAYNS